MSVRRLWNSLHILAFLLMIKVNALSVGKDDVDQVIEDEITRKLGEDLVQSIEKKFQVDLERSVDMVLVKIKLLLQNGTQHIQEKLLDIQGTLDLMKTQAEDEVEKCLIEKHKETSALAEKALHQMVVCGYALIGQDPEQAVRKVILMKNIIKQGVKPLYEQKKEIYSLLKVCGHDHGSLTKVVKCVISKSPVIKSAMMEITGKLINGIIDLSKLMAHGAMHEACLIEVIKTIEDEATDLIKDVRKCAFENNREFENYIKQNNATVLDITNKASENDATNKTSVKEMQAVIKNMLNENSNNSIDERFKKKLFNLHNDLNAVDANANVIDVANNLRNIE
ncbi:uncharacterized protein LOC126773029 [Nymphalis io]|uniref:uncharacterized protein LOC126773029 n=1 Tax=Inachis io TaxID=171585 RepID=UPI00216A6113|nr:uncharacterized protein LOC126773029 [Nymphalis io]